MRAFAVRSVNAMIRFLTSFDSNARRAREGFRVNVEAACAKVVDPIDDHTDGSNRHACDASVRAVGTSKFSTRARPLGWGVDARLARGKK